jgi:hypothetical protein
MRLVLDAGGVSIVVNELGVLRDRRCLTAGKASAAAFFRSIHTSASKPNQRSTAEPTGSRWPTSRCVGHGPHRYDMSSLTPGVTAHQRPPTTPSQIR